MLFVLYFLFEAIKGMLVITSYNGRFENFRGSLSIIRGGTTGVHVADAVDGCDNYDDIHISQSKCTVQ